LVLLLAKPPCLTSGYVFVTVLRLTGRVAL
jgi:hypothetical protein